MAEEDLAALAHRLFDRARAALLPPVRDRA